MTVHSNTIYILLQRDVQNKRYICTCCFASRYKYNKQRTECLAFENGLTEESWFYSRQGRNFSPIQSARIVSGFHPASDSVAIGVKRAAR